MSKYSLVNFVILLNVNYVFVNKIFIEFGGEWRYSFTTCVVL